MKHISAIAMFILAAALMAACGAPAVGNDAGANTNDVMTTADRGNPDTDAGVTVDAATADNPVVQNDAGTLEDAQIAPVDADLPFMCAAQLCGVHMWLDNIGAPREEVQPRCNSDQSRVDFASIHLGSSSSGFVQCAYDRCWHQFPTDDFVTYLIFPMMGSTCGTTADIVFMRDGHPMARTSGPIRLEPQ